MDGDGTDDIELDEIEPDDVDERAVDFAQQRIGQGMQTSIGIGMANQTQIVLDLDPAYPKLMACTKAMGVDPQACSHGPARRGCKGLG